MTDAYAAQVVQALRDLVDELRVIRDILDEMQKTQKKADRH